MVHTKYKYSEDVSFFQLNSRYSLRIAIFNVRTHDGCELELQRLRKSDKALVHLQSKV